MEEDILAIETPRPIRYWKPNDLKNVLPTIESDLIHLMRECNSLNYDLNQKDEASKKETKKLLLNLVDVHDALDRVFKNIESKQRSLDKQTKIWLGNFKAIKRLVESYLREAGVVTIEAPMGLAVPGLHTIIETRETANVKDDTIIEEVEKGYMWHGEVLRKAKVIAVKN